MTKKRIIALIYGPEDQLKISDWLANYGDDFELAGYSEHLTAPIQLAVAHYCTLDDIDGLLIDDHSQYDEIVLDQLAYQMKIHKTALYSASHSKVPIHSGKPEVKPIKQLAPIQRMEVLTNYSQTASKLAV